MNKTVTNMKMTAAIALLTMTLGCSAAHAGWGQNGQYGNAPQTQPGSGGYGGNGSAGRPNVVVNPAPAQRPAIGPHFGTPAAQPAPQVNVVYPRPVPRPAPQVNVVYPAPAPRPVYVPTPVVVRQPVAVPVVVRQPVYVPTAPVVKETVYVKQPTTTVVATTPAPVVAATPAPVVNNNCNCLVKEYPQAGVVVFRDICTKESATYSNLPQQTSEAVLPPTQQ